MKDANNMICYGKASAQLSFFIGRAYIFFHYNKLNYFYYGVLKSSFLIY